MKGMLTNPNGMDNVNILFAILHVNAYKTTTPEREILSNETETILRFFFASCDLKCESVKLFLN